ncbi:protein of unknown function DUF333 [Thiorhodococcus drewsii AZ1]|uniref:Hemolysin n=1 Tax=Thiorhodococcus drewsii AZ1 TaxID=765913 RepID=G2E7S0_9GAMM|nr:protein of unknown function DUF333 [Thiorhodococcus drewsii AZ1]
MITSYPRQPVSCRLFPTIVAGCLTLLTGGCAAAVDYPPNQGRFESSAPALGVAVELPNPAERHCSQDGYQVVPLYRNGIPVSSLCVNPGNGRRCGVWDYYRQSCRL